MRFPLYAAPKLRGIYCEIVNGEPRDKDGKPFQNTSVRGLLYGLPPMIGYITVGDPRDPECTEITDRALRLMDLPKVQFWAVDVATTNPMSFGNRLALLRSYAGASGKNVGMCVWKMIADADELENFRAINMLVGFGDVITADTEELGCVLNPQPADI